MRCLGPLLLLAACKFSTNITGVTDGKEPDAALPDAPPDAFDDKCFGAGTLYFCLAAKPTSVESLDNNATIDTGLCNGSNQSKITIGASQVCAVTATTITLGTGQAVSVTGPLPLYLVATTSITIDGGIDASSFDLKVGPGANPAQCNSVGIDGTAAIGGSGGGGAGGTFGSIGGNGGTGGGATAGGTATAVPAKSTLMRGGCPGGTGMPGTAGLTGPGGNGGGALFLASQGTISIGGSLDVSGGGAEGGLGSKGGGGGGGSGGMLAMYAITSITIEASAKISANGGGGGGGAGNIEGGEDGSDPMASSPLTPALGGQLTTSGRCTGGNGAASITPATAGANGGNGGGGGGGGHGLIRVMTPNVTFPIGTISPGPTS